MKKHIVLTLLICSIALVNFQSCKGDKTPPATTAVPTPPAIEIPEKAADVVNTITVPTFENADVNQFCQDFKSLMSEYAGLKGTGDATQKAALEQKFTDWAGRAGEVAGNIKAEEMQQFNDFIGQAQTQFTQMNSAAAN